MVDFAEKAEGMGLEVDADRGMFSYQDQHSEVVYRNLISNPSNGTIHETDGVKVPLIGIFTKGTQDVNYKYVGYVSELYKFIGNEVLNQRIRESITSVGMPIVSENTIMSMNNTSMRNEIVIQNGQQVANVGDVLPVMVVNNSYDGTRAASVSFGITINYSPTDRVVFSFGLGEMRQVHIAHSNTSVSSSINSYMQVFNENITDMITQSFSHQLQESEMLGVLDLIENMGKRRREKISTMLDDLQKEAQTPMPTAWQMFLAIVRYSSLEPNLNAKRMMENIAESVLVIPQRMYDVLERL